MTSHAVRSILAIALGSAAIGGCAAPHRPRDAAVPRSSSGADRETIPGKRAVGHADAPITIEVFSDFQCAGCADFHLETLSRVRAEYCAAGKVYLIHHEYPLPIPSHQYSREAAKWALASAAIGKYEPVADVLFREQASWGKTGNIEETLAHVLTAEELSQVRSMRQERAPAIDAALAEDLALGRSFPVHGTPSFRIIVRGTEVFADHDEPEKLTATTPRLKLYPNLKRYLDERLVK